MTESPKQQKSFKEIYSLDEDQIKAEVTNKLNSIVTRILAQNEVNAPNIIIPKVSMKYFQSEDIESFITGTASHLVPFDNNLLPVCSELWNSLNQNTVLYLGSDGPVQKLLKDSTKSSKNLWTLILFSISSREGRIGSNFPDFENEVNLNELFIKEGQDERQKYKPLLENAEFLDYVQNNVMRFFIKFPRMLIYGVEERGLSQFSITSNDFQNILMCVKGENKTELSKIVHEIYNRDTKNSITFEVFIERLNKVITILLNIVKELIAAGTSKFTSDLYPNVCTGMASIVSGMLMYIEP